MRFRLLRRRLTISAPRMAVRSALPWPFRWAVVAIMLGFCAAIALWAFEFGKDIAGLDTGPTEELALVRGELASVQRQLALVKEERDKALTVANTSATLLTAEKAAQDRLSALNKQLEGENRALRDDLGFFEKLIPAGSSESLSIRGLQAELQGTGQLKWQVLVIQPIKNAPEFNGRLEISLAGTQSGRAWTLELPEGSRALKLRQYARLEGVLELPPQTVVKSMTAKVMEGPATKAVRTIKL